MQVFEEALLSRGVPTMVYADNGRIFRSDQFHLACASLGISLIHTKAFDAPAKGKIERFFGNVTQRFMPLFKQEEIHSLEELNKFFRQWLEKEYHRKDHSALGMTPLDKYLSQMSQVRMVEDPQRLRMLFLKRETRKVRHDGTISLKNNLYEVPPQFIGRQVELRFDSVNVYVFAGDKPVAKAKPVLLADNARAKREKPALSFAQLQERLKGEEADV